ncbi:MAG: glycosyltransferase [Roseiarcus sp.]
MNVLFVHNNFPAQFVRLANALARDPQHRIAAIGSETAADVPGVELRRYRLPDKRAVDVHPFARRFEAECRRAEQVLFIATALKSSGFEPDAVVVHCGWGENLALKSVFPTARLIVYFEYFYRAEGQDVHFEPTYGSFGADGRASVHCNNASTLLALAECDAGISPTYWQRSTYPPEFHSKIEVVHEGVDTSRARPNPRAKFQLRGGRWLTRNDEVVTYTARGFEPLRGFTTLMRALPKILRERPRAEIVVVGNDRTPYGPPAPGGIGWKTHCLGEVLAELDMARVHFLDFLPYDRFISLLQVSSAHIYLTYPFVLSWSLTEAMAAGCAIVGSDTAPVREVIEDGVSGILAPFRDDNAVAGAVIELLANPARAEALGRAARSTILAQFDQRVCVPRALEVLAWKAGASVRRNDAIAQIGAAA